MRQYLSGIGAKREGCRDAEGKFVPVPQCTGRRRLPKKPQKARKEAKRRSYISKALKPESRAIHVPSMVAKGTPEEIERWHEAESTWFRSPMNTKYKGDYFRLREAILFEMAENKKPFNLYDLEKEMYYSSRDDLREALAKMHVDQDILYTEEGYIPNPKKPEAMSHDKKKNDLLKYLMTMEKWPGARKGKGYKPDYEKAFKILYPGEKITASYKRRVDNHLKVYGYADLDSFHFDYFHPYGSHYLKTATIKSSGREYEAHLDTGGQVVYESGANYLPPNEKRRLREKLIPEGLIKIDRESIRQFQDARPLKDFWVWVKKGGRKAAEVLDDHQVEDHKGLEKQPKDSYIAKADRKEGRLYRISAFDKSEVEDLFNKRYKENQGKSGYYSDIQGSHLTNVYGFRVALDHVEALYRKMHSTPRESSMRILPLKGLRQRLGYVPTPRESRAGKKLIYMLAKNYTTLDATTLPRKNLDYWKQRSGVQGVKVFATFAYSADDAREQIRKGEVPAIHEAGGREAEQVSLVRPSYRPERIRLTKKPLRDYYMFVKKGFRKPKSVGIHEASFYQREMRQGRGTLYQVKARTADEARALIKAEKKEPARLAPKPRPPRRTEAEKEALWERMIEESERVKPRGAREGIPEQMTLFGGVRYDKGDINSTINAALKTVRDKPFFIYATYYGYTIAKTRPPSNQAYIKVNPDKTTEEYTPKFRGLLAGDISTCAYWIQTEDGGYYCGEYAPTCEGQSPGACVVPPPDQYKFCATTQKVKSDPKGRYRGKLITRCKTYRPRCIADSKCIEDRLFPKPEVFKLDKEEIRDIAASMAKEFNLLQKETGPALAREILNRGGLKAYRGKVESEEWAEIPLHLKRKSGLALDEMASEMGFDSDAGLREAIEKAYPKGTKMVRRKTWKDFELEAEEILIDEQQRSEYAYEEPVPF